VTSSAITGAIFVSFVASCENSEKTEPLGGWKLQSRGADELVFEIGIARAGAPKVER
jgi:hypothetical protein